MPYIVRKVRGQNCYTVKNKKTKKVYAKCTTKEKALRQINLLTAIQYNPKFTPKRQTMKIR